jgi:uncharacterized membrane protein YphA (DoxX/SURF4 family)
MADRSTKDRLTALAFARPVSIAVRLTLGAVLVYASWSKIFDAPAFAQMIWNYRLVPDAWLSPMAIVLPWLELAVGVFLIAGVLRRGAALLALVLMLVFAAALAIDLYRGIAVDCGCFSSVASAKTRDELLGDMRREIVFDLGLVLLALQTLVTPVTWSNPARGTLES